MPKMFIASPGWILAESYFGLLLWPYKEGVEIIYLFQEEILETEYIYLRKISEENPNVWFLGFGTSPFPFWVALSTIVRCESH